MSEKLSEKARRLFPLQGLEPLFEEIEDLEASVENLREQMWKQVALKREVEAERDTLLNRQNELIVETWNLQGRLKSTEQKLEKAEAEVKRLTEENDSLSQWKSTGFTEFSKLKAEVTRLQSIVDTMQYKEG